MTDYQLQKAKKAISNDPAINPTYKCLHSRPAKGQVFGTNTNISLFTTNLGAEAILQVAAYAMNKTLVKNAGVKVLSSQNRDYFQIKESDSKGAVLAYIRPSVKEKDQTDVLIDFQTIGSNHNLQAKLAELNIQATDALETIKGKAKTSRIATAFNK